MSDPFWVQVVGRAPTDADEFHVFFKGEDVAPAPKRLWCLRSSEVMDVVRYEPETRFFTVKRRTGLVVGSGDGDYAHDFHVVDFDPTKATPGPLLDRDWLYGLDEPVPVAREARIHATIKNRRETTA